MEGKTMDRLSCGTCKHFKDVGMTSEARNGDNLGCLVRLWVVVEEDRGMGAIACSCHASEEDANKHCSGHRFANAVDVPWSVLESLKPNNKVSGPEPAAKGSHE
jgi:hypothetical protein